MVDLQTERLASPALSSQFDDMKGIQAVKTPAVQPQMHSVGSMKLCTLDSFVDFGTIYIVCFHTYPFSSPFSVLIYSVIYLFLCS